MPLEIGDIVENLTLKTTDGHPLNLFELPKKTLLFIFLRHLA